MNVYFLSSIFILNFLSFYYLEFLTKKINLYDIPDKRKIHSQKISKIGGLILYTNFVFFFFFNVSNNYNLEIIYFFLVLSVSFFISLYNDKKEIKPIHRLIIFYFIFLFWMSLDEQMIINNLEFDFLNLNISLGNYGFLITPLFIVIFLNALNLFDGVNLQSSSYFSLYFIFFLFNNIDIGAYIFLLVFIVFFSINNFRNKVFLGDSGITLFAVTISFIIITNYNSIGSLIRCEDVFAMMFLPGIDMLRLYFLRIFNKKNPFLPDKNHMHHYLIRLISSKYVFLYQLLFNLILLYVIYVLNIHFTIILVSALLLYLVTIIATNANKNISTTS